MFILELLLCLNKKNIYDTSEIERSHEYVCTIIIG
jgi:hypothetical protein